MSPDFNKQLIDLENVEYAVVVKFESSEELSKLTLTSFDKARNTKTEKILEIDQGVWFFKLENREDGQTVKLDRNKIYIALSCDLICLSLPEFELLWTFNSMDFPIYEFYDIEEDILLRGELEVFRIDTNGQVIWRASGEDIWVNTNGEHEIQISDDKLILTDFNGKQYIIPIEETRRMLIIQDSKKTKKQSEKKWWKFWN